MSITADLLKEQIENTIQLHCRRFEEEARAVIGHKLDIAVSNMLEHIELAMKVVEEREARINELEKKIDWLEHPDVSDPSSNRQGADKA